MNLRIESKKVAELSFDPENARSHSKQNLDAIRASLETFGQRKPIVLDSEGVVVAGNGTLQAAISLGWSEIETVSVPDDWTPEQVKAFAIADNRTAELAEWNQEVLQKHLADLDASGFMVATIGFEAPKLIEPNFSPDSADQPRLDQRASTICPNCAFEWRVAAKGEIEPV
jgi:ParB-like chromosome segregation protein Spo0J